VTSGRLEEVVRVDHPFIGIFFSASAACVHCRPRLRYRSTEEEPWKIGHTRWLRDCLRCCWRSRWFAVGLWFRRDDVRFAQYQVTTTSSVFRPESRGSGAIRGVDVGRVESITIEPGASGRIHVRIGVQEDTPITRSTYAQLAIRA